MNEKQEILVTFKNQYPHRDYRIVHTAHEFTSVCPVTGQPDFAVVNLEYIPNEICVELKSLKLYYQSFRNDGIYYESVTNKILEDLVEVCLPRYMRVVAEFKIRGGISSVIEAEYESPEWQDKLWKGE